MYVEKVLCGPNSARSPFSKKWRSHFFDTQKGEFPYFPIFADRCIRVASKRHPFCYFCAGGDVVSSQNIFPAHGAETSVTVSTRSVTFVISSVTFIPNFSASPLNITHYTPLFRQPSGGNCRKNLDKRSKTGYTTRSFQKSNKSYNSVSPLFRMWKFWKSYPMQGIPRMPPRVSF